MMLSGEGSDSASAPSRANPQSASGNPPGNQEEYKRIEDPSRDLSFGTKVQIYRTTRAWQPGWTVISMNHSTRHVLFRRAETRTRINLGYESIIRNVRIVEIPPLQQQQSPQQTTTTAPPPLPPAATASPLQQQPPPELPIGLTGRIDRRVNLDRYMSGGNAAPVATPDVSAGVAAAGEGGAANAQPPPPPPAAALPLTSVAPSPRTRDSSNPPAPQRLRGTPPIRNRFLSPARRHRLDRPAAPNTAPRPSASRDVAPALPEENADDGNPENPNGPVPADPQSDEVTTLSLLPPAPITEEQKQQQRANRERPLCFKVGFEPKFEVTRPSEVEALVDDLRNEFADYLVFDISRITLTIDDSCCGEQTWAEVYLKGPFPDNGHTMSRRMRRIRRDRNITIRSSMLPRLKWLHYVREKALFDRLLKVQVLILAKGFFIRSCWEAVVKDQRLGEGFGYRIKGRRERMNREESIQDPIPQIAKRCETFLRRKAKDSDPTAEEKDIFRETYDCQKCDFSGPLLSFARHNAEKWVDERFKICDAGYNERDLLSLDVPNLRQTVAMHNIVKGTSMMRKGALRGLLRGITIRAQLRHEHGEQIDEATKFFYRFTRARDLANPAQRVAYMIYNHYLNVKYFDDIDLLLGQIYIDQRFPEFLRFFCIEGEKRLQRFRDVYNVRDPILPSYVARIPWPKPARRSMNRRPRASAGGAGGQRRRPASAALGGSRPRGQAAAPSDDEHKDGDDDNRSQVPDVEDNEFSDSGFENESSIPAYGFFEGSVSDAEPSAFADAGVDESNAHDNAVDSNGIPDFGIEDSDADTDRAGAIAGGSNARDDVANGGDNDDADSENPGASHSARARDSASAPSTSNRRVRPPSARLRRMQQRRDRDQQNHSESSNDVDRRARSPTPDNSSDRNAFRPDLRDRNDAYVNFRPDRWQMMNQAMPPRPVDSHRFDTIPVAADRVVAERIQWSSNSRSVANAGFTSEEGKEERESKDDNSSRSSSSSSSSSTSSSSSSSSQYHNRVGGTNQQGKNKRKRPRDAESGEPLPESDAQRRRFKLEEDRASAERARVEGQLCQICVENPRDTCMLPCGHFFYCHKCARRLDKCPACRGRIRRKQRIFY